MKRIRVSDVAEQDLDDIWHYIAKNSGSIEIANGAVESIADTFPLFARTPEAGTRRDEIEPGVRGFPVGKYVVYYRVEGPRVLIARVIHGMRDQKSAFLHEE
jgi:toxin ParE1/3/4